MLAMALLLHGGLLGGMGGEAAGVDESGEGAWTLATPVRGSLAASGTGQFKPSDVHLYVYNSALPHTAHFRILPFWARAAGARVHAVAQHPGA